MERAKQGAAASKDVDWRILIWNQEAKKEILGHTVSEGYPI